MSIFHKETIYAFIAILTIHLFFSAIIPPFQSPDEFDHVKRAYLLSKGEIFMETPAGESTGGKIDTGLNTFMGMHNKYPMKLHNKVTTEDLAQAEMVQWSDERRFGSSPGVNYYLPFIYSPQALGLFLGQKLNLSVEASYFLARFSASLAIAALLLFAFHVYRPSIFIISLLIVPMTVFQFSSASQDGIATALVVLVASIFLRITTVPSPISNKYFYLMALSVLLIATSRINLLPILGLLFMAAHFSRSRSANYILASLVVLLTFLWILYGLLTTVDNRMVLEHSTSEVILHYLKNPLAFFVVLGNTLSDEALTQFYLGSFFGILGWLDASIGETNITTLLYSSLLILVFSISFPTIKKEYKARGILFLTGIISILLLFFLLLITWNKHPATIISGVQGRYFLAPMILIGYSLTADTSNLNQLQKVVGVLALISIAIITTFVMPRVLVERYYVSANNNTPLNSAPLALIEKQFTIESDPSASIIEAGGFVDAVESNGNLLLITGWGYFSNEQHRFLSNSANETPGLHLPKFRPDVAEAMSDSRLNYAGFQITIDTEQFPVHLDKLCLYSDDDIFGKKLILPGSNNIPYKCGTKN